MGAGVIFLVAIVTGALLLFLCVVHERGEVARRVLHANDEGPELSRHEEQSAGRHHRALVWACGAALCVVVRVALGRGGGVSEVAYAVVGAAAGEMAIRVRRSKLEKRTLRRIEFHLPNAMERVVMGVGAGLDVVPALHEASRGCADPVSAAFREVVSLSEAGMRVAEAMQVVSERSHSLSLRHALVHLGIAHAQGGEIVRPLKELSDATQANFQESVEEEIAKLPVKAVLPLVVTFAGLILCFVTVPLLQVGSITRRVAHAAHP